MQGKVQSISWVDTAVFRALNKVLSDPQSLFSLLFSYILLPNFSEGETAAGSHILHSSSSFAPSSSSLRLPLFTSLSSSCTQLQAQGIVSSFPLFSYTGCKICLIASFSPVLSPQDETVLNPKSPEAIHITVKLNMMEEDRMSHNLCPHRDSI